MKKVLIAFDGAHFSEGALEFARQLHQKDAIFLAGIFLPQINYSALWSHSGGGKAGSLFIPLLEDEDAADVQQSIQRFEDYCRKNGMPHSVHKDFLDFALPELKLETRFADLLILSSEKFYEQAGTDIVNDYLKEALQGVECPVIVVPETFSFPDNNILTYDGKGGSVYAIKQFAYLFPEWSRNETLLVYATEKENDELPYQDNISELAACHFEKLILSKLETRSKRELTAWFDGRKSSILVSGAFGGSGLSKLFHKSFVADVIRDHRIPVFIAHK